VLLFLLALTLELAILHVLVNDRDEMTKDDFIGQCAVPLMSLQQGASASGVVVSRAGYRNFHLRFLDDTPIRFASVFAKISIV
jgi:hypothetical protein